MKAKIKGMAEQSEFLKRINKTLYYGQLPPVACLSLPVTEISCSVWSECQRGRSLRRLRPEQAAKIAHGACVSPTALVLALLYVERLKAHNRTYLAQAEPAHLFLVSLMVGNKYLEDNGEDDEVLVAEWAHSSGIDVEYLKHLEIEFLQAIDWKIFVSKQSFEERLQWLEKEVALRQSCERGFFTYTDLRVLSDGIPTGMFGDMVSSVSAAMMAMAAAYTGALLTLLASTLLVTQTLLTTPQASTSLQPTTGVNDVQMSALINATMEEILSSEEMMDEMSSEQVLRCTKWLKFEERCVIDKHEWKQQEAITIDWFHSWWSKTSVLNWLYQSSLINPMQRWLATLSDAHQLVRAYLHYGHIDYDERTNEHCLRLNVHKLSALLVSVAE